MLYEYLEINLVSSERVTLKLNVNKGTETFPQHVPLIILMLWDPPFSLPSSFFPFKKLLQLTIKNAHFNASKKLFFIYAAF